MKAGFVSALNSYYLFIMDFCIYVGFKKKYITIAY